RVAAEVALWLSTRGPRAGHPCGPSCPVRLPCEFRAQKWALNSHNQSPHHAWGMWGVWDHDSSGPRCRRAPGVAKRPPGGRAPGRACPRGWAGAALGPGAGRFAGEPGTAPFAAALLLLGQVVDRDTANRLRLEVGGNP